MQDALFVFVLASSTIGYTTPAIAGRLTVLPLPEDVHYAIRKSSTRSLKRWIAWDRTTLDVIDPESGRTPMMTALINEKHNHFKIWLESGAQLDVTDGAGNSALQVAAPINEPWQVLALLQAGANPRLRNSQSQALQRNLFMTPRNSLNSDTCKGMDAAVLWLRDHGLESQPKN
ncbi:hypothetical protein [Sphingorhabdus sp.]|jgi:hypothetical protein|uniref:hypothetical protein n=1 Tax=Sphingorhabdus sp. TaxID=1902408 RepID=UPI003BAE36BE|nr:hypothetical protein [Sphingomonadales bacterium]MBK9433251.1 hypothetical protein [Sphingomonadales bacterium]MBL0022218.1 hypothetical protein [Sphingomonadales bacterium]